EPPRSGAQALADTQLLTRTHGPDQVILDAERLVGHGANLHEKRDKQIPRLRGPAGRSARDDPSPFSLLPSPFIPSLDSSPCPSSSPESPSLPLHQPWGHGVARRCASSRLFPTPPS